MDKKYLTRQDVEPLLLKYGFVIRDEDNSEKIYYKKRGFVVRFKYGVLTFFYYGAGFYYSDGPMYDVSVLNNLKKLLFFTELTPNDKYFLIRNIKVDRRIYCYDSGSSAYNFLEENLSDLEKKMFQHIEVTRRKKELKIIRAYYNKKFGEVNTEKENKSIEKMLKLISRLNDFLNE